MLHNIIAVSTMLVILNGFIYTVLSILAVKFEWNVKDWVMQGLFAISYLGTLVVLSAFLVSKMGG